MVEANKNQNAKCTVKHFQIDEQHSFAQYSVSMPEETFKEVTG